MKTWKQRILNIGLLTGLAIGSSGLAACQQLAANLPVTPLTLAGCWKGVSEDNRTIRFDIESTGGDNQFSIDGSVSGLLGYSFDNYKVKLQDNELKPQAGNPRFSLISVGDAKLTVRSLLPPIMAELKRCQ